MYYIVNQTNHIIAADDALLALLSVNNIGELQHSVALNAIEFTSMTERDLDIKTADGSTAYAITSHTLSSLLGEMTLVEVSKKAEASVEKPVEDEPITFDDSTDEMIEELEETEDAISILDDEEPFDLLSDDKPFILDESPEEESAQEVQEPTQVPTEDDDSEIVIDIDAISQKIGITSEDYNNFLNEYIDTALSLEEDLKSTVEKKKSHAVATLSHLSNVLHLPVIQSIMSKVEKSNEAEQNEHIGSLYHTLARLTTHTPASTDAVDEIVEDAAPAEETKRAPSADSFGSIDLSAVKPIHFDFQLEEAANDLSLPVELIEEFVVDFLDQARVETEKMLEAYEQGDLDAIQKIGHLLKGTSSNLRINPLADTLYKIQFCEDSNQLEDLIKEYWAHFLSFEHQIDVKLKK